MPHPVIAPTAVRTAVPPYWTLGLPPAVPQVFNFLVGGMDEEEFDLFIADARVRAGRQAQKHAGAQVQKP